MCEALDALLGEGGPDWSPWLASCVLWGFARLRYLPCQATQQSIEQAISGCADTWSCISQLLLHLAVSQLLLLPGWAGAQPCRGALRWTSMQHDLRLCRTASVHSACTTDVTWAAQRRL